MAWGISHQYKFIFVHNPKSAGTTICSKWEGSLLKEIVRETGEMAETGDDHCPAIILRDRFPKEWKTYFKFAVVRNPYDRFVSKFYYTGMNPRKNLNISWSEREAEGMFSQLYFITDNHERSYPNFGKVIVDTICRYETLEDDLVKVFDYLDLDVGVDVFPHFRSTDPTGELDKRIYEHEFTPTIKSLVDYIYREDITRFHYSWDGRLNGKYSYESREPGGLVECSDNWAELKDFEREFS